MSHSAPCLADAAHRVASAPRMPGTRQGTAASRAGSPVPSHAGVPLPAARDPRAGARARGSETQAMSF